MNLERVWDYALRFKPQQKKEEFLKILQILEQEKVKTVLEIGTNTGGTARAWLELGCSVVSIDPEKHGTVGRLESGFKGKFRFIHGYSWDVVDKARGNYDLVYIDGDHSEEACRKDWEMYGAMGRIVGFHDIMDTEFHHTQNCYVDKVFREACIGRKYLEIKEGDMRWGGWGLVWY